MLGPVAIYIDDFQYQPTVIDFHAHLRANCKAGLVQPTTL